MYTMIWENFKTEHKLITSSIDTLVLTYCLFVDHAKKSTVKEIRISPVNVLETYRILVERGIPGEIIHQKDIFER